MSDESAELLEVGRVARAHGLRGELRVELHFAGSDALGRVDTLKLRRPDGAVTAHAVEASRAVPKAFLVKLGGIDDRNAAEACRGAAVLVARAGLPPPEESEFYLVDLVGAEVVGPEGSVGVVTAIATHPSVDAIVIQTPDGGTVEQPLLPDFVARVDVAAKRVELSTLDGLIG